MSLKRSTTFFFQAEDGIRDVERSRGLGDVYKRQVIVPGEEKRKQGGQIVLLGLKCNHYKLPTRIYNSSLDFQVK